MMAPVIPYETDPLFAWNRLDDSPDLKAIKPFFEQLPGGARKLALPLFRPVQRRQALWQDGASEAGTGLAPLPLHPPGHQAVRASLQGPHGLRADSRAAQGVLGRGRWQCGERGHFLASVGLVMVVHIGLAALLAGAPCREVDRLGKTKLSPIAQALPRT